MTTPMAFYEKLRGKIKREWKLAFLAAAVTALLVHMPALLMDVPNHDGLDSMYFDQNMITSGRWFLMVACGFSSFYTIPWVIGLLGILFLSLAAAALTEALELKKPWVIVVCSGLLASFPALASTFAYVFTLDGYMLALLLAVLAVVLTKKYQKGFLAGGVCLAFSLGIYQAYLPFAMILSVFCILMLLAEDGTGKEKLKKILHYLYMGILGVVLYYGILQVLLRLQGKQLASYQGIDGMAQGNNAGAAYLGKADVCGFPEIYPAGKCVISELDFRCGAVAAAFRSPFCRRGSGEKQKMVEEAGIFRYNNTGSFGAACNYQCDFNNFSFCYLPPSHAVSVGAVSDWAGCLCGKWYGGGKNGCRFTVAGALLRRGTCFLLRSGG